MPSSIHLPHLITTNDLLISAALLSGRGENTDISVLERRHYLTSRQKHRHAVPDAWISLFVDEKKVALWVEIDRGSEDQEYIKRKVRTMLSFPIKEYREEFTVPLSAYLFVTTEGASRLTKLMQWTEQELRRSSYDSRASLLYFTCVAEHSDEGIDPQWLFTSPIWRKPFDSSTVSLF